MVGGMTPSRMVMNEKAASIAPAADSVWPIIDLLDDTGIERMRSIPVSSNKSMIGHTLSAAGAIEAAFSFMTMREGVIPPTINYDHPDPAIELDVVPNVSRRADVASVLSNSFGFGGQNTCLVMTREAS